MLFKLHIWIKIKKETNTLLIPLSDWVSVRFWKLFTDISWYYGGAHADIVDLLGKRSSNPWNVCENIAKFSRNFEYGTHVFLFLTIVLRIMNVYTFFMALLFFYIEMKVESSFIYNISETNEQVKPCKKEDLT